MPERYKRNKSGYYRETFVIGKKPNGTPDRVEIRDKDLKVFKKKVEEARRLHAKGVTLGNITVYEWGQRWLTVYKANANDEQKAHFKAKLELDIYPAIGSMPIKDVRASHLQELLNQSDKGYGTVVKIRIAIRQLFNAAEAEGIIERDPSRKLELPEDLTEKERRPLTDFECQVVWDVAQTHSAGAYVLTLLLCGLRRGECVGLQVENVDLKRKRLMIQEAIRYRTNKGQVKGPKTRAGIREVPIPELLLPFLIKQCKDKSNGDYVFTKVDGSRSTETTCKWWWKSFVRSCHLAAGAVTYRNKVIIDTKEEFAEWSLCSNSALPKGIALSPEGLLLGIPIQAGHFSFTLAIGTGGKGASTMRTYVLAIAPCDDYALTSPRVLLPTGEVNAPYSCQLSAASPFGDDVTPHFLRHTYSTDMYSAGIDEKAQEHFMGHKSMKVTDVYRKMSDDAFGRAAALINEYFNSKYLVGKNTKN